jgi:hypothetical protein
MATTMVLPEPRLDTLLMVEREIQRAKSCSMKRELWLSLPRKLQHPTFNRILKLGGVKRDSREQGRDSLDLSQQSEVAKASQQ